MRLLPATRALLVLVVLAPRLLFAQSAQSVSSPSVPRLINVSGVFQPANGQPAANVETVTLSIYADQEGGAPLWQETQTITVDAQGRYSLLLGASSPDGVPAAVFASGEAKWLGTVFERAGEVEGPRVRITSVPYALRASDADTLGGRPASAYQLATGTATHGITGGSESVEATPGESANLVQPGVQNFLAKYLPGGADVGTSAVYEAGGKVGIGTTGPADFLHVAFSDPNGAVTGYAVQNTTLSPNAYSGMLFYDHTGALGQFQGFNNSTHEYRINNIARVTPGGAFNGSINFMIGGASRFFVSPTPNGNVGIGTTTPTTVLEVSNANSTVTPGPTADIAATSYGENSFASLIYGRKARGTPAAPTAVLGGDGLGFFGGRGHTGTGFSTTSIPGMWIRAAENFTNTAQGTSIQFDTIRNGTTQAVSAMTISSFGGVGVGTMTPFGAFEVSNSSSGLPGTNMTATIISANAFGPNIFGRKARGTPAAPSAAQTFDPLAFFGGRGYGTTGFGGAQAGMVIRAAENFTDTAQGALIQFHTIPSGSTQNVVAMTLASNGNVGIGTGGPQAAVEIVRQGGAEFLATTYSGGSDSGEFNFTTRVARGTQAAPAAVQAGDELGGFGATGYGATGFGELGAGLGVFAAENWTDAAQGAALMFGTTPLGSNEAQVNLVVMPGGNVGIGQSFNDFPTITDRLQVFGDIRVGTTGTNGCIKNFAGTGVVGTCASDRRFKKDITPFASVLDGFTKLQPVHYFWRSADFPERQFGNAKNYGLIAQDVEQVLPELVATDSDGYKAVDYSKLPLLTIQAVKDLNTEVTDLKSENDALKQRVAELERLVTELLAASRR
jgi:hypothetical protein